MNRRTLGKIAQIENLNFSNETVAALHNAVTISGYAYSEASGITNDGIDAALFGERVANLKEELANIIKTNSTSKRTNCTLLRFHTIKDELNRLMARKKSAISAYQKALKGVGVTLIKYSDACGEIRNCIPLCRNSFNHLVIQTRSKVYSAESKERTTRSVANLIGSRYNKIIPEHPEDIE